MKLTDEAIREFAEIWKREFAEDLTPEQAATEAQALLSLFLAIVESKATHNQP